MKEARAASSRAKQTWSQGDGQRLLKGPAKLDGNPGACATRDCTPRAAKMQVSGLCPSSLTRKRSEVQILRCHQQK
jgi:hypothetical protein